MVELNNTNKQKEDMGNEFEPIIMPKMKLNRKAASVYFVYKTETEFSEVESDTAREAIEKSGVSEPYKVLRYMPELDSYYDEAKLIKVEDTEEETKPSIAEGPKEEAPKVETSKAEEDKPEEPKVEEATKPE